MDKKAEQLFSLFFAINAILNAVRSIDAVRFDQLINTVDLSAGVTPDSILIYQQ